MDAAEIEFPTNAVPNVFAAPGLDADLGAEAARQKLVLRRAVDDGDRVVVATDSRAVVVALAAVAVMNGRDRFEVILTENYSVRRGTTVPMAAFVFPAGDEGDALAARFLAVFADAGSARVAVISHDPATLRLILFSMLNGESKELPPIRAD